MDAVGLCNLSFCLQYGIFITVNSAERVELGTRKIYIFYRAVKKKVLYFSGRHEKQNTLTGLQFFTQFLLVAFFFAFLFFVFHPLYIYD